MVLLGGLEILGAAYLINEHKKHKKERARIEEDANFRQSRPRPSRRRSHSPPRRKHSHDHEKRTHRKESPQPSSSRPSKEYYTHPCSQTFKTSLPMAALAPASYYRPPPKVGAGLQPPYHQPGRAYSDPPVYKPQVSPLPETSRLYAGPSPMSSPYQRPVSPLSPQDSGSSKTGYLDTPHNDVADGFSPSQRHEQPMYASASTSLLPPYQTTSTSTIPQPQQHFYTHSQQEEQSYPPIHYPDHLVELGDPPVHETYQYEDGLIYDERRNRHVRFALPRDGDESNLEEVGSRGGAPPPYMP